MSETALTKEFLRRETIEKNNNNVIGTEFKNQRILKAYTMKYTIAESNTNVSISYLSKVENNKIRPNMKFSEAVCKVLNLSSTSLEFIFKSRDILLDSVKYFEGGNFKKLQKAYDDSEELTNYRAVAIRMIYNISQRDINNAVRNHDELMPLASTMGDMDVVIFCLFSGILHCLTFDFEEAIEELSLLKRIETFNELRILRDKYLFIANYALNSIDTVVAYNDYKSLLIDNGMYDKLDEVHYIMALYYVKNSSERAYLKEASRITNKKYRESVEFYRCFLLEDKESMLKFKNQNLNNFCQIVKAIYSDNAEVKAFSKSIQDLGYEVDYDYLLLNYLAIDEIDEKISFITNSAFSKLQYTKEGFLIKYFFKELSYLTLNMGKYKIFQEWYLKIHEMR